MYLLSHGVCSCSPLKYTHIDLSPHAPRPHHLPYKGNPVLALSYCYLIQGKCLTVRNDVPFEMQYVCEVDCKPVCALPCQPCGVPCDPCCTPCPPMAEDMDPCSQKPYDPCSPVPYQSRDPCCQLSPAPAVDQCPFAERIQGVEPMSIPNVKRNGLNCCA